MSGEAGWRKPRKCNSGHCAEVRDLPDDDTVMLRSSRRPGQIAMLDRGEFAALIDAAKNGEYDDLTGTPVR